MKRIIFSVLALLVLLRTSFFIISCKKNNKSEKYAFNIESQNIDFTKYLKDKNDTITIVAVGDIMLGTNYPTSPNYLPPNDDCSSLIQPVIEYLRDADLTFGNNEGAYSDEPQYAKGCNDPEWCYRFSIPTKYVNCLVDAGFDVVSIANNHVYDLGIYGKDMTVKTLTDAGLNFAGIDEIPLDTFTINGVKYGFCAFAPNEGTCQITDYDKMREIVKKLDEMCRIVIVSFHGGAEGSKYEHLTFDYEYFLGQNRGNVYKFAHLAIDAGADVVIGHGPHVTRSVELYKDRFIAYSLGNFCTYRRFNIQGVNGIAPIVKLWIDKDGKFIKGKITPVYQDKMTGTKLDEQGRIIKRLQELTKEDFPDGLLEITDDGEIIRID